jgi:hypothetical protein
MGGLSCGACPVLLIDKTANNSLAALRSIPRASTPFARLAKTRRQLAISSGTATEISASLFIDA